jgi:NADP-reducing hydrogenase subunit HndB
MSPITASDLRKIRERIKTENAVRHGIGRAKVTVHMGTCGIASGARDVLESLLADIARHGAADVIVAVDDCVGLCDKEPLVTIHKHGEEPIKFENMSPDKMREIFKIHFIDPDPGETPAGD